MEKQAPIALIVGSGLVWTALLINIVQPWRGVMSLVGLTCIGFSIGWKLKGWKGGE